LQKGLEIKNKKRLIGAKEYSDSLHCRIKAGVKRIKQLNEIPALNGNME